MDKQTRGEGEVSPFQGFNPLPAPLELQKGRTSLGKE